MWVIKIYTTLTTGCGDYNFTVGVATVCVTLLSLGTKGVVHIYKSFHTTRRLVICWRCVTCCCKKGHVWYLSGVAAVTLQEGLCDTCRSVLHTARKGCVILDVCRCHAARKGMCDTCLCCHTTDTCLVSLYWKVCYLSGCLPLSRCKYKILVWMSAAVTLQERACVILVWMSAAVTLQVCLESVLHTARKGMCYLSDCLPVTLQESMLTRLESGVTARKGV